MDRKKVKRKILNITNNKLNLLTMKKKYERLKCDMGEEGEEDDDDDDDGNDGNYRGRSRRFRRRERSRKLH